MNSRFVLRVHLPAREKCSREPRETAPRILMNVPQIARSFSRLNSEAEATSKPVDLPDRTIRSHRAMKIDLSPNPPDVDLMGNRRTVSPRARGGRVQLYNGRTALTAAGSIHLLTIERVAARRRRIGPGQIGPAAMSRVQSSSFHNFPDPCADTVNERCASARWDDRNG